MSEASFTIRAVRQGFPCELTLTDSDTKTLMTRALAALEWLASQGFEPPGTATATPAKAPTLPDGTPDPAWCAVHGVAMTRRERDGQVWYSHKLPDGTYCKGGKAKNGA